MKKILPLFFFLLLLGSFSPPGKVTEIRIRFDSVINPGIIAAGVQWSAYPHADSENAEWGLLMTDEKWGRVYQRLDYIKPGIVRVMDQAGWRYFKGVDSNNNPVIDFGTDEVRALFKILDYCQKNNIAVIFGEWGAPAFWNEPGQISRADDPRWIHMITRYLDFLVNKKGYSCIRYYNLVNEPNGNWASVNGDWEQWEKGVRMLADSIFSIGLKGKVGIAGPDAVANYDNPASQYKGLEWVDQTMSRLDSQMAVYEVHAYPDGEFVRSGEFGRYYGAIAQKVRKTGKKFLLGELGLKYSGELYRKNRALAEADPNASADDSNMFVYDFFYGLDVADALIQAMGNNLEGAIAWDLDDAMHTNGDTGDKTQLKRWGMWNSLGTELCNNPSDENLRPWFYTWSLMCRYFPTGTATFKTEVPEGCPIRIIAGKFKGKTSIALLNNSDEGQEICLSASGVEEGFHYSEYRYQEGNCPADANGFPVALKKGTGCLGKGISLSVPPKTFLLLTNLEIKP